MADQKSKAPAVQVRDNTNGSRGPVNNHGDLLKNYQDQEKALMAQRDYYPPNGD